jgi:hypothetical protein
MTSQTTHLSKKLTVQVSKDTTLKEIIKLAGILMKVNHGSSIYRQKFPNARIILFDLQVHGPETRIYLHIGLSVASTQLRNLFASSFLLHTPSPPLDFHSDFLGASVRSCSGLRTRKTNFLHVRSLLEVITG